MAHPKGGLRNHSGFLKQIEAAKRRLHHNVLAIALANKLARIVLVAGLSKKAQRTAVNVANLSDRLGKRQASS